MNRIFDFSPSHAEAIVPRILLLVHRAVDEHFPAAEDAGRQFSKTVFSDDSVERTAIAPVPEIDHFRKTMPPPASERDTPPPSKSDIFTEEKSPSSPPPAVPPIPIPTIAPAPPPSLEPDDHQIPPLPDLKAPHGSMNAQFSNPSNPQTSLSENATEDREDQNEQESPLLEQPFSHKAKSLPPTVEGDLFPKDKLKREPKQKSKATAEIDEVDWTTRVTLALLLAGLLLLLYLVFSYPAG